MIVVRTVQEIGRDVTLLLQGNSEEALLNELVEHPSVGETAIRSVLGNFGLKPLMVETFIGKYLETKAAAIERQPSK